MNIGPACLPTSDIASAAELHKPKNGSWRWMVG
jgi:hypothetical protein